MDAGRGQGMVELIAELDPQTALDAEKASLISRLYDWLDVPDSPMGKPSINSLLASCMLSGINGGRVIAHLRVQDLNLLAFKSTIKTLRALGIRKLVVLRGDQPYKGSSLEDVTVEEAVGYIRRQAPGIEVGVLVSARKSRGEVARRLDLRPDFILLLNYRSSGIEWIAGEARRRGIKVYPYLVVETLRNRGLLARVRRESIVALEDVVDAVRGLAGIVDGVLVSSPGDFEGLLEAGRLLAGLRNASTLRGPHSS